MANRRLSPEKIADILAKVAAHEERDHEEQALLRRWISISAYNRSVYEQLCEDSVLRKKVLSSRSSSGSVWTTIICYRAALHNSIRRRRNFWGRLIRPFEELLRFK